MPRGYRCVIVAAFGWLSLAASKPEQATQNSQANADAKVIKTSPAPTIPSTVKPVDPPKYSAPCKEPQTHDQCDLEAQWKAADAADKTAWWTVIQTILSAAGFVGLLVSLYYTRKAVLAAEDATKDADTALEIAQRNAGAAARGAIAAMEGNTIAREGMQRQLRAQLFVGKPIITYSNFLSLGVISDTAQLTLVCRNYGQTPAHNVKLLARAFVGGIWNEPFETDFDELPIVYLGDIPPTDFKDRSGYTVIGLKEAHQAITEGTMSVFVDGVVNYNDAFGELHATRFRYASTEDEYKNSEWSETPLGNVSM